MSWVSQTLIWLLVVLPPVFGDSVFEAPRQPNTELLISDLPSDSDLTYTVQSEFSNITPWFVVEYFELPNSLALGAMASHEGYIHVFPLEDDVEESEWKIFWDMRDFICFHGESGLQSVLFDPEYEVNGHVYLFYNLGIGSCDSNQTGMSVISRVIDEDPSDDVMDPVDEEVLLTLAQPHHAHNGGELLFGPDGMLYVSFGDGGDQQGPTRAQSLSNLYGTIVRIDVKSEPDPGLPYKIPFDNPFYETTDSSIRKEIYAFGLRNPYKLCFDPFSSDLLAVDVGAEKYDEINRVIPGANYGWGEMEGPDCREPDCDQQNYEPPLLAIPHDPGNFAVGGISVYDGSRFPELFGKIIYTKVYSGEVFSLEQVDGSLVSTRIAVRPGSFFLQAQTQPDGSLYLIDYSFSGGASLKKLAYPDGVSADSFPRKLSDMPALLQAGRGDGEQVAGVYYYEPSSPLWSDFASKERYFALPGLSQISRTETGGWGFPEETVLIKNFSLPLDRRDPVNTQKRIETRLLYKKDSEWYGFSYEWNDEESDAVLLTGSKGRQFSILNEDGEPIDYTWYYPSRSDCFSCHTGASNVALGLTTASINHSIVYPGESISANQLEQFNLVSLFDSPLPDSTSNMVRLPSYNDESLNISERARAYLDSNCSMCHQPLGPAPVDIDFRFGIESEDMQLVEEPVSGHDFGLIDPQRLLPGDPEKSVLYLRMTTLDKNHRMPPIASSEIDPVGSQLIREWIERVGQTDAESWRYYE